MSVAEKELKISAELGFPTEAYFEMVEWLNKSGYTVKKIRDWLYINPQTQEHQQAVQQRQQIEQNLGRVMQNIGEMRQDLEMLKHDLRKFENALEHHREGDLEVLKTDFVDKVDQQTQNSMLELQSAGRFPSIVVDFFRIESEEDIEDLDISESEKSILRTKWSLFQQWRESFARGVEERVGVLREEVNSRKASLENYKESIRPYLEAMHKLKTSQEKPQEMLSNPSLIEGFITKVAGVELAAWRGIKIEREEREWREEEENPYDYYIHFDIDVRRDHTVVKGEEVEAMRVNIKSDLKTHEEIEEIKREIEEKEEALMKSLEEFRGERDVHERKREEELEDEGEPPWRRLPEIIKGAVMSQEAEEALESDLENLVEEQTIEFYDSLKEITGGMKFQRRQRRGA